MACFLTHAPISGRDRWPATNGTISCSRMLPIESSEAAAPARSVETSSPTSSGVTNTPSRVEADALHTAAGMLPRAIDVKAMADCTVAGSTHRYITPT